MVGPAIPVHLFFGRIDQIAGLTILEQGPSEL